MSTLMVAWRNLLKETDDAGRSHQFFADDLNGRVLDELLALTTKSEDARKKVGILAIFEETVH
jgi:hypothetical protein